MPQKTVKSTPYDVVLRGGTVLVMDAQATIAQAVGIRGSHIEGIGSDAEVSEGIGEDTRVIELDGRTVMPGINDAHLHGSWLGARWPSVFFGAEHLAEDEPDSPLVSTAAQKRAAILRTGQLLAEAGITSYTEPGIGPGENDGETGCFDEEVYQIYLELARTGQLMQRVTLLRLYGLLDGPSDPETVIAGIAEQRQQLPDVPRTWLNVSGVKIFGDLVPITRQAWTQHTYDTGGHGGLIVDGADLQDRAEGLTRMVMAGHEAGLQVAVHATGDRTIGLVLDAIEQAAAAPGAAPSQDLAHCIVHADMATPAQIRRMQDLGVWYTGQAGIAVRTSDWVAQMLPEAVVAGMWRFAEAAEAGVLTLTSDAPILDFDWRQGVAQAEAWLTRTAGDAVLGGAHRRLHHLLCAYTSQPAKQDRAAAWKGTVEVEKVADLVVLDQNPYDVGAAALPQVQVELTMVGGRVVFERSLVHPPMSG